ncbi:4Fe-4S binding protein [bacterium]|nr:4Fe-4S binding protein [bacterium]RQV94370.1 MAG: 4Fe-4S dicluster domain-containing protein [bacterium]
MKRKIIHIDEEKCTGCGLCIPNCPEGAIQMIDVKARLISDLFCDGLGACLGHCPEGAITIGEREAEPYDERKVMENIIKQGPNVVHAHLIHLKEHNEENLLKEAIMVLKEKSIKVPETVLQESGHPSHAHMNGGCPGSKAFSFSSVQSASAVSLVDSPSMLSHWPVQLHLISPMSSHFQGSDLILAADCVAYALGGFHQKFLKGKTLAIACPKLDEGQDIYLAKVTALIDQAKINTLTVIIMEVPCCSGLLSLAKKAAENASRKVPLKCIVVSRQGEILKEEWV